MVPLSLVCPYCGDTAIEPLPEAQLVLGQFNLSKPTPTQLVESNHV